MFRLPPGCGTHGEIPRTHKLHINHCTQTVRREGLPLFYYGAITVARALSFLPSLNLVGTNLGRLEMIYRNSTLAEWPYCMVRLACDLCPRCGQCRKDTLIARFGGDALMPDVRHLGAMPPQGRGVRGVLRGPAGTG
jgi:hypothetical protein